MQRFGSSESSSLQFFRGVAIKPKIPLFGYSDNFLYKVYFFLHSSKIVDRERSSSTEKLRSESDVLR